MKDFALSIGGTPVPIPTGLQKTYEKTTPYGNNILQLGVQLMFITAIVLSLFFLVFGGIQWIMSGGDKEGLTKARNKITYAIIGLVVTLLSFFIVSAVGKPFGIDLLGIPLQ